MRKYMLLATLCGAAAAHAHDQTECTLEHEVVCDDTATDTTEWLDCALFVADICAEHTHPTDVQPNSPSLTAQPLEVRVRERVRLFKGLRERIPQRLQAID